jgi:hypothetical protein
VSVWSQLVRTALVVLPATHSVLPPRVVITPVTERPGREADLNSRRGHEIVHRLQNITAPSVFNPRAFFDGKKNMFSVGPLKMQGDAAEVREALVLDARAILTAHV